MGGITPRTKIKNGIDSGQEEKRLQIMADRIRETDKENDNKIRNKDRGLRAENDQLKSQLASLRKSLDDVTRMYEKLIHEMKELMPPIETYQKVDKYSIESFTDS